MLDQSHESSHLWTSLVVNGLIERVEAAAFQLGSSAIEDDRLQNACKATKTTKLRGIQELRRETCMPLLLYSGSEAEAECALGYIDTGNKKGCFTGFS